MIIVFFDGRMLFVWHIDHDNGGGICYFEHDCSLPFHADMEEIKCIVMLDDKSLQLMHHDPHPSVLEEALILAMYDFNDREPVYDPER